jgi:hypothetical protein
MRKWEYCYIDYGNMTLFLFDPVGNCQTIAKSSVGDAIKILNDLGKQEWEVCGYSTTPSNVGVHLCWTLKRPVG